MAENNSNFLSHSSGAQKPEMSYRVKIKLLEGLVPLGGSREECVLWLFQHLAAAELLA